MKPPQSGADPVEAAVEAARQARRWPKGLYVHLPYCPYRCPYCDFNAYVLRSREQAGGVVDAILREAEGWARLSGAREGGFRTLYLGGGTPTLLTPAQIRRLLGGLRRLLPLDALDEVTVEANPGTLTPARLEALVEGGVRRVSLGAQSMDPLELRRLGRWQSPAQVERSVRLCRAHGIANISVDVMFALPGQHLASLMRTLDALLALEPQHVSAYCLTLEPGTPFFEQWSEGRLRLPGERLQAAMYRRVVERLRRGGWRRYEVSNFARPGYESAHNLLYWRHEEYLGLGPGAHSFWEGVRFATVRDPGDYARAAVAWAHGPGATVAFAERLTVRQRMEERLMLALRLEEGLDRRRFAADFGLSPEQAFGGAVWDELEAAGLLERKGDRIRLTDRGMMVADAIVATITATVPRPTTAAAIPAPAR
ncbi:radical SAM family heme chaperone HemW [Geochorda subterranea]|uniref:Heme chaperone HemW n=1 Tax=Geochorda subterranea TaxID=3109564 RepID=A0ABZ1BM58_9FIRM|nr:radical SAM family heme chaperone HemW [Limnochorda sp. LNt]WRP13546.1 radical SAM family heme chaperone HemW [Limnochorda sp. LNt]